MPTKLILRLVLAIVFATFAIIFSELIPPIGSINLFLIRALVTFLAGILGFAVFPELATQATTWTISIFNFIVRRVSTEILDQLIRLPSTPLRIPFTSHSPSSGQVSLSRPLILDTSAIIDGRILDIAKTGFIFGTVLVPASVLRELQQVADSADFLKRARGRRGFEVIEDLKKVKNLRVEVWDKETSRRGVDDQLIQIAKNLHGKIVTTDFNLNRVASVSNVGVLNVNDLANAVKTVAIPGERLKMKIMHLGKDASQGVGYLDDGTMIVVSAGAPLVGKTVEVEVTKSLQIPAGRMIFAKKTS